MYANSTWKFQGFFFFFFWGTMLNFLQFWPIFFSFFGWPSQELINVEHDL
jgi:hypothetical protein